MSYNESISTFDGTQDDMQVYVGILMSTQQHYFLPSDWTEQGNQLASDETCR